jgi:hypothetical protein
MFSVLGPKHAYRSLLSNEDLDSEEKDLFPSPSLELRPKGTTAFCSLLPWALCVILSIVLIIVSTAHDTSHHHGTYETGFDTELGNV